MISFRPVPLTAPAACSIDGSPMRLDTEHAALVAREDQPEAFPLIWRCTAAGHTWTDRAPDANPRETRAQLANRANGAKGGVKIRRLKAAGRFYRARPCRNCGTVFQPTASSQLCGGCR